MQLLLTSFYLFKLSTFSSVHLSASESSAVKFGAALTGEGENGSCTFMGPVKIKLLNDLIECSAMKKKSLKTLCAILKGRKIGFSAFSIPASSNLTNCWQNVYLIFEIVLCWDLNCEAADAVFLKT